ncbi:unnamed protein product [Paramecium sonneborni]|uniref:Uncharacterized protein n=1 Tax=Paramecium sonneborni TaxID=65129 RepID=A0A8S1QAT4_9CILI|nr:unnamed protein product [Paramecium sonneborni]
MSKNKSGFQSRSGMVINCFNRDNPINETFQHNNPNALTGFLTWTSFSFLGAINFQIEIIQITSLNVSVGISNTNNIKQLGYQIILGIEEAFVNLGVKAAMSEVIIAVPVLPKKTFLLTYLGFILSQSDAINLIQSRDLTTSPGELIYKIAESAADPLYSKNFHLPVWVSNTFTKQYKQLKYSKIQIFHKQNLDFNLKSFIQFEQQNQIFNQNGIYRILIDQQTKQINFLIQIACYQGLNRMIKFVNCQKCDKSQTFSIKHSCDNPNKLLLCKLDLFVVTEAIQELVIIIENFNFQIKQILYNSFVEEVILIQYY